MCACVNVQHTLRLCAAVMDASECASMRLKGNTLLILLFELTNQISLIWWFIKFIFDMNHATVDHKDCHGSERSSRYIASLVPGPNSATLSTTQLPRMRSKELCNHVFCLSCTSVDKNIETAEIRGYSLQKRYWNNV